MQNIRIRISLFFKRCANTHLNAIDIRQPPLGIYFQSNST